MTLAFLFALALTASVTTSWSAGAEPAPNFTAIVTQDGGLWPQIQVLPDGTLLALGYNAPAHTTLPGDVDAWASADGGKTWKLRATAAARPDSNANMCHWASGFSAKGELLVVASGMDDAANERGRRAPNNVQIFLAADGGTHWTKSGAFPERVAGGLKPYPFGSIVKADDGSLHTVVYTIGEKAGQAEAAWRMTSRDDGRSWQESGKIADGINETVLLPLGAAKQWLCIGRTSDRAAPEHGQELRQFRSTDDGTTWSDQGLVAGWHLHPPQLLRLKDGRILLTYGNRRDGAIESRLSADDGRTWAAPQRHFTTGPGDTGYPSTAQLPDGNLVTVFYAQKSPLHDGYHMGATGWSAPKANPQPAASNGATAKPATDVPLNARVLMYPRSDLIERLEWTGPAHKLPGSGSDMHWHAWGADGALYVVDDDGENFGGPRAFAQLLKVEGRPPEQKAHVVSRFPGLQRYSMRRHLYVNGALAVGARLYVAAYEYDSHDPARAERRFVNNVVVAEKGDDFFVLDAVSHHGGVASLMYSDDAGVNWKNYPVANAPLFLGPRFAGLAFVGFGPGYTGVPDFLEGYVYAISNDESWESGSHVFLARVPKDQVLDRAAWRFYGGRSATNEPAWIPEDAYARPIITDHGHVGHPTMTYVPALKRFLLAFGSDAVPKSYAYDAKLAWATWHRRRELQIYEGPTPWGPWALVHYDPAWEGDHIAYLPQLPPCWFSPDGKEGIMMFSGDYRMWGVPEPANHVSWYGQMTRPFRLVLK